MKFKEVLNELRQTILSQLANELKKMPSIEKIIKTQYIADGVAVFARTKDGNAYEVIIRPAPKAKMFKDLRGK